MREEVLRMTHVTRREQGSTPLRDFNLNIFAGEIMGLISLNGGHGMTVLIDLWAHLHGSGGNPNPAHPRREHPHPAAAVPRLENVMIGRPTAGNILPQGLP
mgnify:CR=1 FL=1